MKFLRCINYLKSFKFLKGPLIGILTLLFIAQPKSSYSQKTHLNLQFGNTIFSGIDNYFEYSVNGYRQDETTITANGCKIDPLQKYIRAVGIGRCTVTVSYSKNGAIDSQVYFYPIERWPGFGAYFDTVQNGRSSIKNLLSRDSLEIFISNGKYEKTNFKIESYACAYVPKYGIPGNYLVSGNKIPKELKKQIFNAKSGDKILIDNIYFSSKFTKTNRKRASPIVLSITNDSKIELKDNIYCLYQENKDTYFRPYFQAFLDSNNFYNFNTGTLKIYQITLEDTVLIEEIYMINSKLTCKKNYYPNGTVSQLVTFDKNSTLGKLIKYHRNGELMSKGEVISYIPNIYQSYRDEAEILPSAHSDQMLFLDSFLLTNFAPYGKWKGYYNNGQIAFKCEFKLVELTELNIGEPKKTPLRKVYLSKAKKEKDTFFKSTFTGQLTIFNSKGLKIKNIKF